MDMKLGRPRMERVSYVILPEALSAKTITWGHSSKELIIHLASEGKSVRDIGSLTHKRYAYVDAIVTRLNHPLDHLPDPKPIKLAKVKVSKHCCGCD
jgi:hypothetical protein